MKAKRPLHRQPIESLESRVLLSASLASIEASSGLSAAQIENLYAAGKEASHRTSGNVNNLRHGPLSIVNSTLVQLYEQTRAGTPVTSLNFGNLETQDGKAALTIDYHGKSTRLLHRLEKLGFSLTGDNSTTHALDGYLPVTELLKVSRLQGVDTILGIDKPILHSEGVASNQAESAELQDQASSLFGVDGTGVKVGVISDSVNQVGGGLLDSETTGDLPSIVPVNVLQDGLPGDTDEGRAMLEELYDMAPGAQFFFSTGDFGQDGMASAINSLAADGCTVICDDLGYADEPFFNDGVISQAITTFVTNGGSYFSAAGNDGDSGYMRTNVNYTTVGNNSFVNFAPAGQTPNSHLDFTVSNGGGDMTLEWDEFYNGDTGNATSEMDLLVYNLAGQLVAESNNPNIQSGIPTQDLQLNPGQYYMQIQLSAMAVNTVPPDMYKFALSSDAGDTLSGFSYPGIQSSIQGHAGGQYTISVGAVPFSNAPPFSAVTPIDSEPFSSTGPIIYEFDQDGNRLAAPITLDKPDISGIDGINTSFFGEVTPTDPTKLPQFFGTSAATPNVAAVAILIDQYHPGSTEEEILRALQYSATPLNGTAAGVWDPTGGAGLVDAVKALQYFQSPPTVPVGTFTPISSPQTTSIPSETITFNQTLTGLNIGDFTLTLNGLATNLLTANQTLTTTDNQTFTLNGLASATGMGGTYTLTLAPTGAAVIAADGLPLEQDSSVTWQNNSVTPAAVKVSSEVLKSEGQRHRSSADLKVRAT